jgi:hypothetical protein|tara:strand:- start:1214 stop:1411 length:198 start_codon:yes stop_codon:yes gene_type:complete
MKDINNKGDNKMEQKIMEEANQHFAISNFADIILDSGANSVLGMIKQLNPDAYQELVMASKTKEI